jgi:hypothetical protein
MFLLILSGALLVALLIIKYERGRTVTMRRERDAEALRGDNYARSITRFNKTLEKLGGDDVQAAIETDDDVRDYFSGVVRQDATTHTSASHDSSGASDTSGTE